jgi:hypothetical protein
MEGRTDRQQRYLINFLSFFKVRKVVEKSPMEQIFTVIHKGTCFGVNLMPSSDL